MDRPSTDDSVPRPTGDATGTSADGAARVVGRSAPAVRELCGSVSVVGAGGPADDRCVRSPWITDSLPLVPTPWGDRQRCLVPAVATHGAYSLAEVAAPVGWARPDHVHHAADESYYVASGEVDVVVDDRTVRLSSGHAVHVPRGMVRALRQVGDVDARLLVVQTPGGQLDEPCPPAAAAAAGIELLAGGRAGGGGR